MAVVRSLDRLVDGTRGVMRWLRNGRAKLWARNCGRQVRECCRRRALVLSSYDSRWMGFRGEIAEAGH